MNEDHIMEDEFRNQQLGSAQTLLSIALISAPVSLVIGGVLLDIVALVCALVARGKIKGVLGMDEDSDMPMRMLRQSSIAIGISLAALIINLIFMALAIVTVYGMFVSGELDAYIDGILQGGPSSGIASNDSLWDS